jgi:hypothetical protein
MNVYYSAYSYTILNKFGNNFEKLFIIKTRSYEISIMSNQTGKNDKKKSSLKKALLALKTVMEIPFKQNPVSGETRLK